MSAESLRCQFPVTPTPKTKEQTQTKNNSVSNGGICQSSKASVHTAMLFKSDLCVSGLFRFALFNFCFF